MKIKEWLTSLLPTFSKDSLLEDIRITRGEMDQLNDIYQTAATELTNWKYKSTEIKSMISTFKSMIGGADASNPIVHISKNLKIVMKNLDTAESIAVSILNGQIASKGMSYKQAILVQYCDALFMVSRYARKWLNMVLVYESAEYKENGLTITESIPKAEIEWLKKNFVDFCVAYKATIEDPKKVTDQFSDIPELDVESSDNKTLTNTLGPQRIDPFKLGFIATKANPIYFVRMIIAEWQVKRYKESREELSQLQLRMLYLKRLQEGKPDAAIEKQIRYLDSRIQALSSDLAEMEKEYV